MSPHPSAKSAKTSQFHLSNPHLGVYTESFRWTAEGTWSSGLAPNPSGFFRNLQCAEHALLAGKPTPVLSHHIADTEHLRKALLTNSFRQNASCRFGRLHRALINSQRMRFQVFGPH